jgi:hypothetical protein
MDSIFEALAQFGPLGMWTASLLWMNHKMYVARERYEEKANERLAFHQENIVDQLKKNAAKIEKALEKIDLGMSEMKEAEKEARIRRMSLPRQFPDTRQY